MSSSDFEFFDDSPTIDNRINSAAFVVGTVGVATYMVGSWVAYPVIELARAGIENARSRFSAPPSADLRVIDESIDQSGNLHQVLDSTRLRDRLASRAFAAGILGLVKVGEATARTFGYGTPVSSETPSGETEKGNKDYVI